MGGSGQMSVGRVVEDFGGEGERDYGEVRAYREYWLPAQGRDDGGGEVSGEER